MKILLTGGRILDPANSIDTIADMLIVDGVIEKIASSIPAKTGMEVHSMNKNIVAPGFIDMHVHLREPGFEHKETILTGCQSAAAGGFTAVCCMPNTTPPIDEAPVVRTIIERGKSVLHGIVDVHPVAAVTRGREGKQLAPMLELAEAGAVAFSDDGAPVDNTQLMKNAFEYSSMTGKVIIQHAEDRSLSKGGVMNEGLVSTSLGMPAIPSISEEVMIGRDIDLLEYAGGRYHVAHMSTEGSVGLIRSAKKKKLNVTCEVTPHHFSLTDEAVRSFDTNTKMNPPLRTSEDVGAIKEGLRDGTIDCIATDHAPHSYDEKQVEYIHAPFGIVGLETAIGLSITELVVTNILSIADLIKKFSTNPRAILRLPSIQIKEGTQANLTLIDPELHWTVDVQAFKSKSKNSPFHQRKLQGRAIGIINNGTAYFV